MPSRRRVIPFFDMRIDNETARRMLLAAQGLMESRSRPATRHDVPKAVRRMGALQIDTISVVARSPYFVLWSRLGTYEPAWLDESLAAGKLFEFWAHAACLLPMEDYPLYRSDMEHGHLQYRQWLDNHPEVAARVWSFVVTHGEARSTDFKRVDGERGGWWSWTPEKTALECFLSTGRLMISRRDRFQRVYAPTEHVLKGGLPETLSPEESLRLRVLRSVKCLGIAKAAWIADYLRLKKSSVSNVVRNEIESGGVMRVDVDGWEVPGFVHPDNLKLFRSVCRGALTPKRTTFLMPFDPVVWDRRRAQELFGFNYRIEVYTPGHSRQFGYLSLPILHRDGLVGRIDAKAHRKNGRFEVRALHLENGVPIEPALIEGVGQALRDCARWHETPEVIFSADSVSSEMKLVGAIRTFCD